MHPMHTHTHTVNGKCSTSKFLEIVFVRRAFQFQHIIDMYTNLCGMKKKTENMKWEQRKQQCQKKPTQDE